ncbi:AMP-binding protein [Mycobacterium sp. CVI_P3]|uniref:AMP-binding protein n=1 Tax=Mycobacterium pinniadriaticum TaxID=2994102 RepID=A0ABT3SFN0_9MYCO|nr:AMP-binding protein [Mycobacterium pinniadriaticum]MCX2931901.1 AMP-binding protein [Mycobacterium pinniadriaticum]MCX2938288.1 AMP-binding protein [Mycobacterium pinniadriaticum]
MSDQIPPIGTRMSQLAAEEPDRPAVSCDGRTLTRAQLESASNRLARAYAELGVKQGDYVTIAVPNSIEWVLATVAVWKLGAIPQPLSPRLPDAEFEGLLDLKPRGLLVGLADPRGVVPSVDADFTGSPDLSDDPLPEAVSPSWKSIASGGSTGRPKLIEAGGEGRIPAELLAMSMGNEPTDTQLVPVPLSHNTGFTSATIALLTGQHLVLLPRFDPERFLRIIGEYRVNYLTTVPTIMQRLLPVYHANPDAYDLSSLRRLWHVAAVCPPNVKQAWIDLLGPDAVWELYGGTELQALTFISGSEWLTHRGSVGRVVAGEMKVLDDDGNECPPGVLGEIYMRPNEGAGPTYRYIGSTAKSRDGWDSLGDLGWFDDEGYLYLADRRVDMFTVGGRNVYPAEIENALSEHPAVLSCLVVGVPHEDLGQVPYALIHTDGTALDDGEVTTFVAQRLSDYKVPRAVEFVDTPLRDDAGKARRSAVRDEVIARLGR